jgi:hypothetical protein
MTVPFVPNDVSSAPVAPTRTNHDLVDALPKKSD